VISEYGTITEERSGKFGVQITVPGQCDECQIRESCYANGKVVWVPRRDGLGKDDAVQVTMRNVSVLGVTAILYGLPLLAVLGGILLGYFALFAGLGEDARVLASVGVGAGFLAVVGFAIARIDRKVSSRITYAIERAP